MNIEEVRERLALDFLLGETRRLPDFLHTQTVSAEEKRDVLTRVPANIRAGCEVVRFPWFAETPVIVDRVGRRMIK